MGSDITRFGGEGELFGSGHTSKFLTRDRARAAGFYDNSPGMFFASSGDGLMKYSGDGNTLVVSPPGGGKGVGFVIPNLLTYPGSMVVIDPKGENAALTADVRRQMGQKIIVLDPAGVSGHPTDYFDPMWWLRGSSENDLGADIQTISEALVPGDGMDGFWARGGRDVSTSLIYYLLAIEGKSDFSLLRLHDVAFGDDAEWWGVWKSMRSYQGVNAEVTRAVRQRGNWFMGLEEKHQLYHRGTLQDGLRWLGTPGARNLVQKSSFEMRKLKDEEITVYVCIPPLALETYKPFARMVVAQSIQAVMSRLSYRDEIPLVFMLDEFANSVGQMGVFNQSYSQIRQYGGRLAIILQTLDQLQSLYPENKSQPLSWKTIEETSGAAVYFKARGETAVHVSKRLGTKKKRTLRPLGGPAESEEPVLSPQEVSDPPPPYGQESIFAFVEGLRPIWAKRLTAYSDEEFKHRYSPADFTFKAMPGGVSVFDQLHNAPPTDGEDLKYPLDLEIPRREPPLFTTDDAQKLEGLEDLPWL